MTATTLISSLPPTRAPRASPTSPTQSPPTTISGSATPSPAGAATATITRAWRSPRAAGGFRSSVISPNAASTCRSEEHTSELQSLMRISYAVFCLKKKTNIHLLRSFLHISHYEFTLLLVMFDQTH